MTTLEGAIAFFRQEQAALFRSTVDIKFISGETFNPTTGAHTPTFTVRAQNVPCLIRPRSTREVQAGEEQVTLGHHEAKFPVNTVIEVGDLVDVVSSAHDAGLVGRTFVVVERYMDDWQIARRVVMEVNEG